MQSQYHFYYAEQLEVETTAIPNSGSIIRSKYK